MMEHKEFGYRETDFVAKMHGLQACLGTVIEGVPVETRSQEGDDRREG